MRGNGNSGGSSTGNARVSLVESLSEPEIKKSIRSDATQHPTTILPVTLSILMLIVYLVFPPSLGPVWALILFLVFGVLAAVTYFWRYALHFNQLYEAKVQQVMAVLSQESSESGEVELQQLQETLKTGFANLNTNGGLKALSQLNEVYQRLQPVLESKRSTDPMAVAHIPTLAEETYKQGLSVLADSLGLMTAVHSPTNERLEKEIVDIERELERRSITSGTGEDEGGNDSLPQGAPRSGQAKTVAGGPATSPVRKLRGILTPDSARCRRLQSGYSRI